ncbi:unnamed protein product [Clavelina lepadiformis]|uniref:Uncharacterized protein n=1 Tax=Clavelina lepadiformis TaxID=159417 RepID=A0ABP0G3Z4_CLALP
MKALQVSNNLTKSVHSSANCKQVLFPQLQSFRVSELAVRSASCSKHLVRIPFARLRYISAWSLYSFFYIQKTNTSINSFELNNFIFDSLLSISTHSACID